MSRSPRGGSRRPAATAACGCGTSRPAGVTRSPSATWQSPASRSLTGLGDDGFAVQFSPDGTRVAAASRDRKTHVWDVASGRELQALDDGGLVRAIAFSPDGSTLASGCEGGVLHVWDLATAT